MHLSAGDKAVTIIAQGSGKSTQLAKFLWEAGYTKNGKMIGVTQPRRIGAVSGNDVSGSYAQFAFSFS